MSIAKAQRLGKINILLVASSTDENSSQDITKKNSFSDNWRYDHFNKLYFAICIWQKIFHVRFK